MQMERTNCAACAAECCGSCSVAAPRRARAPYAAPRWVKPVMIALLAAALFCGALLMAVRSAVKAADAAPCSVAVLDERTGMVKELEGLTAYGRTYVGATAYADAFGGAPDADVVYYGGSAYLPLESVSAD